MKHLSAYTVLAARHYFRYGWTVGELARLYGINVSTLSRAVHGHTHARLTEPPGWTPPPLPTPSPTVRRPAPPGAPQDQARRVLARSRAGTPLEAAPADERTPAERAKADIQAQKEHRGY